MDQFRFTFVFPYHHFWINKYGLGEYGAINMMNLRDFLHHLTFVVILFYCEKLIMSNIGF